MRSFNNAMMVAAYFRRHQGRRHRGGDECRCCVPGEIAYPLEKARIAIALCRCQAARGDGQGRPPFWPPPMPRICAHCVFWGEDADDGLEAMMAGESPKFEACDTAADDVCLIAFTSGTTGVTQGHECISTATCSPPAMPMRANVLCATPEDRFIGSPPLAFTFGLGGIVLFPLHIGASAVLLEKAGPHELAPAIEKYRASVCFTAPTAYRAMLDKRADFDLSSLRKCVSARRAATQGDLRCVEGGDRDQP